MSESSHFRRRMPPAQEQLREIEVLLYSANDLKNVKHLSKMRTYAEAYVERSVDAARTRVDEQGGANPVWNQVVKLKFRQGVAENDVMAALNVDIYAHGHVREKPVGSARVLLSDVLKGGGDAADETPLGNPIQFLTVRVWRPSGRPHGLLNLWVPPTGRFLVSFKSLSFSLRGRDGTEEEVVVVGDEAAPISGGVIKDA
ncbi:BON1-associated protein 2-like [Ipomoea triloba]|uniref:BON1-associated protein 2-like n=1 Tax=Ipomoea triloba TaxID=35885 RepID=UPI00125CDF88|nr:BON1-associated protein 2-like [Ipomoea triloba]